MDLLEHLVDVDAVGLLPAALLLLITLGDRLLGLASLLGSLSGGLGWHVDDTFVQDNSDSWFLLLLWTADSARKKARKTLHPIGREAVGFASGPLIGPFTGRPLALCKKPTNDVPSLARREPLN